MESLTNIAREFNVLAADYNHQVENAKMNAFKLSRNGVSLFQKTPDSRETLKRRDTALRRLLANIREHYRELKENNASLCAFGGPDGADRYFEFFELTKQAGIPVTNVPEYKPSDEVLMKMVETMYYDELSSETLLIDLLVQMLAVIKAGLGIEKLTRTERQKQKQKQRKPRKEPLFHHRYL